MGSIANAGGYMRLFLLGQFARVSDELGMAYIVWWLWSG